MFEITVNCQSRYPVGRKFVISEVEKLLSEKGLKNNAAVSIYVCGRRKVRELSRRYLKELEDHEVLSFPYNEVKKEFVDYPDNLLRLGDIIICFPIAREMAMDENKLIDQVIAELACHGVLHLLGEHHEE
ncbi:rRNA maturation RNase YbeY [Candidatus Gottesmanbacteria bacterium RIFCSPHIGHO2_01_FULL_42_12]|uniref:rRNA maturation RNase YbeY n=1 Tax=Candidatus Gottesmanbacteria bacterium RIFCSPHIGHO2_01_FULL_42_12 TaxID=1798377 RepID=A0A1F5Z5F0_9BACT|nr:MAG: rRNA maturation RNase YbeY [Candidatus Gottesmanbacteria bacterium RIFCSPHIGHO2_01_FULL_42_12]